MAFRLFFSNLSLSATLLYIFILIVHGNVSGTSNTSESQVPSGSQYDVDIRFAPNKLKMSMDNTTSIDYTIIVNKSAFSPSQIESIQTIFVTLKLITLSPQFDIIQFAMDNSTSVQRSQLIEIPWSRLIDSNYSYNASLIMKATYIGHATIESESYMILKSSDGKVTNQTNRVSQGLDRLSITVIRHEGILDKIFMYSVIIFITISYINLGAQIDTENMKRLIETPRIIFLGFLIGATVMPAASWIAGHIFFENQPMYRVGSFIYACSPAASASVLWTVMFDADKELSLGLQIASTLGALLTMPVLLFAMDKSIDLERNHTIKVPYMNLARTLVTLSIALLVGSRFVGCNKRARQISQRIFRPLTMFVLLFIIVFSSIVYWYIYQMFDWNITLMAIAVTSATYLISGLFGYLLHRDFDHMITISISSTYRNSGIAFAALVVAFQAPDIFIAYVPCLTQVVTTSLIGLVFYVIKSLKTYFGY